MPTITGEDGHGKNTIGGCGGTTREESNSHGWYFGLWLGKTDMSGNSITDSSIIGEEMLDLEDHVVEEYKELVGTAGFGESSTSGPIGMQDNGLNING